jgi:hypothetical protein
MDESADHLFNDFVENCGDSPTQGVALRYSPYARLVVPRRGKATKFGHLLCGRVRRLAEKLFEQQGAIDNDTLSRLQSFGNNQSARAFAAHGNFLA